MTFINEVADVVYQYLIDAPQDVVVGWLLATIGMWSDR